MEFDWSWWTVLVLFIYIVVGGIGVLAITEDARTRRGKILTGMIGWLIGFAVVNGVTWMFSGANSRPSEPGVHAVSSEFGLVAGQSYPVRLGSRVSGTQGAFFWGGIFSGGSATMSPGTAISVSFTNGSDSYILEIPTSKVTFSQTSSTSSTVRLYLLNNWMDGAGEFKETSNSCETLIHSLVLLSRCDTSYAFHMDDDVRRRGLAPIVADNIDSATITLSPELYSRLLGEGS